MSVQDVLIPDIWGKWIVNREAAQGYKSDFKTSFWTAMDKYSLTRAV